MAVGKSKPRSHVVVGGRPVDHAEVGRAGTDGGETCIVNAHVIFVPKHVRASRSGLIKVTHLTVCKPCPAS